MKRLSQLRLVFIVYLVIKIAFDIVAGERVISGIAGYFPISPDMYYTLAITTNIVVLLIGLLIFYFLLEKKNWARIVLLVIGWLAVIDFFSSMLVSSTGVEILSRIDPTTDWDAIMQLDRVSDFFALLFWGYAIYILQFRNDVKSLFRPQSEVKDSGPH